MRWTVTRRIALGFGMGVGLAALISSLGLLALRVQQVRYETALDGRGGVRLEAAVAQSECRRAVIDYLGFLIARDEAEAVSRDIMVMLATRIERLRDAAPTAEERADRALDAMGELGSGVAGVLSRSARRAG